MLKILCLTLCFLRLVSSGKELTGKMDFCANEKCKDTLQRNHIESELDGNQYKMNLLLLAPCPPPWDMSAIFDPSLCVNCDERVLILNRCLKEWNLELDCENILACGECNSCNICGSQDDIITNNDFETTTIKPDQPENGNSSDATIAVSVSLSVCGILIVIILVLVLRRRRLISKERMHFQVNSQKDGEDLDIEAKRSLQEKLEDDTDKENDAVTDKLVSEDNSYKSKGT